MIAACSQRALDEARWLTRILRSLEVLSKLDLNCKRCKVCRRLLVEGKGGG
jgi:hypothetical protein